MVTCFRVGSNHPTKRLNLHVSTISSLSTSYTAVFNDLNWQNAMNDEYNALIKNNTWTLVHRPTNANIVHYMWLFRHKYLADITLSYYKARLVTNSSMQLEGSFVTRDSSGMFLFQHKYANEILKRTHMLSCNSGRTPVNTESKLGDDVQHICLYMHDPREPHFLALKRVFGPTLSRFSAKAEYRGVVNAVAETCWLRNLLRELHTPLSSGTLVYYDNVSAVYLSCNPVQHQGTKHIEIDIHFVRDLIVVGQVHVLHVPSRYQFADIFTKGLPSALFEEFRTSLSVRCPPAPTAGEC
ncbi:ribonuclease H-like domain-containing protein [Tanacetum coccineum]